jgi:hypothetical protein
LCGAEDARGFGGVLLDWGSGWQIVDDVRCVLDNNIVVAAMRSPGGASAFLLVAARRGQITMLANVALALEYEATRGRLEHVAASGR